MLSFTCHFMKNPTSIAQYLKQPHFFVQFLFGASLLEVLTNILDCFTIIEIANVPSHACFGFVKCSIKLPSLFLYSHFVSVGCCLQAKLAVFRLPTDTSFGCMIMKSSRWNGLKGSTNYYLHGSKPDTQ